MIGHGSQLLHTEEFAHLTNAHLANNAAHEVSTPITWEPGWSSKDWDVTLVQKLGDSLFGLIRNHVCCEVFCEMVLEHQDVCDLRQSIQLHGCLNASKIYMQEIHLSSGHNWVLGCFGQIAIMLQAIHAGLYGLLHLVGYSQLPEVFLQQRQGMVMTLMTGILVAPIQGSNMVCLGDHKEQKIFRFTYRC